MHLVVDTKQHIAKLLHGRGMVLGTLEFDSYEINRDINSCNLIFKDSCPEVDFYLCSECRGFVQTRRTPEYCPCCGLKIDKIIK